MSFADLLQALSHTFYIRNHNVTFCLVSLRLKNLTRTQKEEGIIKRAEKQLLNERIRNINYKIEKYQHDKYMYEKQLQEILQDDQEMWNAC